MICPNCKQDKFSLYIAEYCKCNYCGMAFLPGYTDEQLRQYYSSGEYRGKFKQANETAHQKRRAAHIAQYVGNLSVYIDIGSSMGILLDEVRKTGAVCYGVDLDPVLAHDVYPTLYDVPQKADCITLIHSLEHMIDPLKTLIEVYEKLNNNGCVVIEVPNGTYNSEGRYYRAAFSFPHVSMFDDESLVWTMQAAGFEIESVEIHGRGGLVNAPEWYYLLAIGKKG